MPKGETYIWDKDSTYIRQAPYFDGMTLKPSAIEDIKGARVLAVLGDSVTTDHISPAGSIKKDGPAGKYLIAHGVQPADFNSYGSRRGNHEVMVRGTFANVRLRNKMVNTEGGFTRHLPDGAEMTIFEASEKYQTEKVPLVILAGKEYGSGSSRDWAAKGSASAGRARGDRGKLRTHSSLESGRHGNSAAAIPARTECRIAETGGRRGVRDQQASRRSSRNSLPDARSRFVSRAGRLLNSKRLVRIDTPQEALYYANGGILQYVLAAIAGGEDATGRHLRLNSSMLRGREPGVRARFLLAALC